MTNNGNKTEPGVDILGLVKALKPWVDVPEWAHESEFHAYCWFGRWAMRVQAEGIAKIPINSLSSATLIRLLTPPNIQDDDQTPVGVPA